MAGVTSEQCRELRAGCPGPRAVPARVLIFVAAAVVSGVVALGGVVAATRTEAATVRAKMEIHARRQERIEAKLDAVLQTVTRIEAGKDRKDGAE